jgi:hypothetical protein
MTIHKGDTITVRTADGEARLIVARIDSNGVHLQTPYQYSLGLAGGGFTVMTPRYLRTVIALAKDA